MAGRSGAGRIGGSSKPLSVEQIVQEAQNYEYNPQVALKYWLRSANTLLKEAEIYEQEGNDQQTYLLLFRHAQLVLGRLTHHPDVGPNHRAALVQAEKDVKAGLAKMEVLKPRINKKHERYQRLLKEREAKGGAKASSRTDSISRPIDSSEAPRTSGWEDGQNEREALAAGENRDLAVQLAKKEIRRRAAARKATLRAGIPEEVEQERRTGGVWGHWERDFASDHTGVDGDALSKQMQNVRLQVDDQQRNRDPTRDSFVPLHSQSYNYPSVQQSKPISLRDTAQGPKPLRPERPPKGFVESLDPPPPPPPKDDPYTSSAPARPPKQPHPSSVSTSSIPTVEAPNLKPSEFTFKHAAYLENGTPLRTVFLPPDLRHRFVQVAASNTARNLETCGILCGTLISNALFISRLVIPEQISTSDTCETVNEGDLFDYVDSEDLMMLGWIHTHPTQTCFMSSRDLHTHGGYQTMLPESIAIVCAPSKQPDWGVFRLTDPPGLKSVLTCKQTGLFHPHDERNMYTDALRPGHVFEAKGMEYDVYDMRK